MKTKISDIQNRVQFSIGEKVTNNDFSTLYNSSVSELNEISHLVAPTKRIRHNNIIRENPSITFNINPQHSYKIDDVLKIPEYYVGSNELIISTSVNGLPNNWMEVEEIGDNHSISNEVRLLSSTNSSQTGSFTITREIFDYNRYRNIFKTDNVVAFKLPSDFNNTVRLESVGNYGGMIKEVSINSFDYGRIINDDDYSVVFYIDGEYIFVVGSSSIEFRLTYTRKMNILDVNRDLSSIYVDIDSNFANLIALLITHKFLENTQGSEDSETQAVYKKYMILKNEYIETNVQKRIKRNQMSIEVYQ